MRGSTKDVCGDRLSSHASSNSHGTASPIHFHEFAGFPVDPQRCLFRSSVGMVLFIKLNVLIDDRPGNLTFM